MKPVERMPFTQWADINRTEKFISVEPRSGYRRALREDEGGAIYLSPQPDDEALGSALLDALDRSRFIWPPDEPQFFEADRITQSARKWHEEIMSRYAYKTKQDLYRNMNWVRAKRSEGQISLILHDRDKPGYWRNLSPDKTITIPETRDTMVVGATLRLALDRCG